MDHPDPGRRGSACAPASTAGGVRAVPAGTRAPDLVRETLRTVEFLAGADAGTIERFAACGRVAEVPAGHVFWRIGESPQGIAVPVTAELASISSSSGGHQIVYALLGPGECAGVAPALDGLPHVTEVRAIRGGAVFVVDHPAFAQFLGRCPAVRQDVVATVGRLYRRSLEERDRLTFLPVRARLARLLLDQACVRRDDGARVLLRATQTEVAGRLGSVREVVARAFGELAERGLVRRDGVRWFVGGWAGLRAEAGIEDAAESEVPCRTSAALRTRRFFLRALYAGSPRVRPERLCAPGPACTAESCPVAELAARTDGAGGPDARPARRRRPAHAPSSEDACVRTAYEQEIVEEHIRTYRNRVAAIESRFGADERVPATVSVFARGRSPAE